MILELNIKGQEFIGEYQRFEGQTEQLEVVSEAGHDLLCEADDLRDLPGILEKVLKGTQPEGYKVERNTSIGAWDSDLWFEGDSVEFQCSSVDMSAIPDIIRAFLDSINRNLRRTDPKDTPDTIPQ